MNSILIPSHTAQTSASAEVERGFIDYLPLVDHLQQSNNLPAVQDDAQYAQLNTRLDVFENRLTDVEGTVIAIRDDVKGIRDDVKGIRDDVKGIRDDVKGIRDDFKGIRDDFKSIRDDFKSIRGHVSNIQQDMTRVQDDVTGMITDIRVLREALGREMDSLCVVILNIDSRSKKSRQDRAKVNIKLKTS
ncbi:hypothetical protein E4U40_005450 [Claviceps sp. LM458 group G5]|nr:hypothetical protein E4U40_005450 [Claviceps sp. LM458 group G5]